MVVFCLSRNMLRMMHKKVMKELPTRQRLSVNCATQQQQLSPSLCQPISFIKNKDFTKLFAVLEQKYQLLSSKPFFGVVTPNHYTEKRQEF